METFQFELVGPDQLLFSEAVESVVVPGTEGEFTMLVDHAPLVTGLRNGGVILVNSASGSKEFAVFGGVAEVTAKTLTVLAERTTPLHDVTIEGIDQDILTAQTYLEAAREDDERRVLSEKIAQLEQFRHIIQTRQGS
jgi:F-type H+-transporting ATPase subunit epsilon